MSEQLKQLLEQAKNHVWTEEEKRQHIISFAYGNVHLHNPSVTRDMIEKAYSELNPQETPLQKERDMAEDEREEYLADNPDYPDDFPPLNKCTEDELLAEENSEMFRPSGSA